MARKVTFMCTAFRDGFQSVYGARVLTPDFLPALEAARDAGIEYFEAGGGARFQSMYYHCNEDAFDMMDAFRETAGPDTELQTLARGVNAVGLDSQPSDIIRLHADLFARHGITTIRNFDALNDVGNLMYSGRCITEAGLKHQVCVTMMSMPPGCTGTHDPEFYMGILRRILDAEIPFDSVCFKDASGTSVPSTVYETIKQARQLLPEGTHLHFHTHDTAGLGVTANVAALEADADAIDLSLAPCSGGTCQPDVLVMWHALKYTEYELDVDVNKIREAEEVFKECMKDYFLPPEALAVQPLTPWSGLPGGDLAASTQMLRDDGIMDRLPDTIRAMREVVELGGVGTSVTPVSQFYFQQAYNNAVEGPWAKIAEDYGRLVLGYFGKTPVAPDPKIVKLASQQLGLEPAPASPLELSDADPEKGVSAARARLEEAGIEATDESIFITATCGDKGIAFLKGEAEVEVYKGGDDGPAVRPTAPLSGETPEEPAEAGPAAYTVTVNGRDHTVVVDDATVRVDDRQYDVDIRREAEVPDMAAAEPAPSPTPSAATAAPPAAAPSTPASAQPAPAVPAARAGTSVEAHLPGKVLRIVANQGAAVESGSLLLVLEAMKMEIPITAPSAGTVAQVHVAVGDQVPTGAVLVTLT